MLFLRPRILVTPIAIAVALLSAGPAGAVDYVWLSNTASAVNLPAAITIDDTLSIACSLSECGSKVLDQAFTNNGVVKASETLYFYYNNAITNGWQYQLQGDVGLINAYYGGRFINESSGSLVKTSGAGVSAISIDMQAKGGSILDAVTGTIAFTAGTASFESGALIVANAGAAISFGGGSTSFADGVRLLGAGQFTVSASNSTFGGAIGAANLNFAGGNQIGNNATLTSNALWTGSGSLSGQWTVAAGSTLTAQGTGSRLIIGDVTNLGTINTDAPLYFQYGHTLDNQGLIQLQGDVGLINSYYGGVLINSGTLAKTSGSGTANISGLTVSNSGRIDAQSGVIEFNGGSLNFNDGSRFTGAGQVLVSSAATFTGHIATDNLVLAGAAYQGGSGAAGSKASLSGSTRWTGGTLTGTFDLAADHTLTVAAGSTHAIQGSVNNLGTVNAADTLYFYYGNTLSNAGRINLQGDVGLINAYYGGRFVNESGGSLVKTSGAGSSDISIDFLARAGSSLEAKTGTINFTAASASFDAGAMLTAQAGAAITFGGGSTAFADGVALLGAGQFTVASNSTVGGHIGATHLSFASGNQTGSNATLTSDALWTGSGSLSGQWTIAGGTTLTSQGPGSRLITGTVSNLGTINTDATLYFQYGNVLDNHGLVQLQGDVGLVNSYYGGVVNNSGTLAKTSGAGTSAISGLTVNNSGRIDAQSGRLEINGGSLNFNDGSRFTGAGQVIVSSAAAFSGQIHSDNLVLAGAAYSGSAAATLHGTTRWTGGSLNGQWDLAADHTLAVEAGSSHLILASVTNHGTINASDSLYFQYGNQLGNAGVLNLNGDVGLVNSYYGGALVNSGRVVKTAGTGEANLASISVSNTGSIEVQSGTVRLPEAFSNDGTLTGTGSFASANLSNNGHLVPGSASAPGSLTLVGNLVQATTSTLDIGLQNASSFGLLQVQGNVSLGGTLALSCFGACHFTAGTDLRILDGTGSLTGMFDRVSFGSFAPGAFSVVIDTAQADVWLHVNQNVITTAVPEPKSWAMLLGGLGVVAQLARRRKRVV